MMGNDACAGMANAEVIYLGTYQPETCRWCGARTAVTEGQHSITDIGKMLGLTVSRISRLVKAGNENLASGEAWPW